MLGNGMLKYYVLFAILCSCNANDTFKFNKFIYPLNKQDIAKIGYESFEDDQGLGIISIILHNNYVYLVDNFHGNIKKIDVSTGEIIKHSPKLSTQRNPWPRDITFFRGNIYVSSDLDSIYVLDENLKVYKSIYLNGSSPKYFIVHNQDSLCIYFDVGCKMAYLTKNDNISDFIKVGDSAPYFRAHGKGYSFEKEDNIIFLNTEYYKVKLNEPFPNIFEKFDAINVDYNKDMLVYYDVNKEFFTLFIYRKE